jgi:hypothetical protein
LITGKHGNFWYHWLPQNNAPVFDFGADGPMKRKGLMPNWSGDSTEGSKLLIGQAVCGILWRGLG